MTTQRDGIFPKAILSYVTAKRSILLLYINVYCCITLLSLRISVLLETLIDICFVKMLYLTECCCICHIPYYTWIFILLSITLLCTILHILKLYLRKEINIMLFGDKIKELRPAGVTQQG